MCKQQDVLNPNFHPQWLPKPSKTRTPNAIFLVANTQCTAEPIIQFPGNV